jgi:hypothetical protein
VSRNRLRFQAANRQHLAAQRHLTRPRPAAPDAA